MKKYSLVWWYTTGKKWAQQDKVSNWKTDRNPAKKLLAKLAFRFGYLTV